MMKDVKARYLSGGTWKAHQIARAGKHKHESTRPGRLYVAIPPAEGWPGGLEEKNGYKKRG